MVFINEDCFIHDASNSQRIKLIINQHPNTLFIVFMAIANVHFDEYLLVRKNLLISSKSIKPESLDDILGDILKKETTITSFLNMPTLSLSRTESSMLRMWMAGQGTIQISDQMNIKAKTVSSHKGNIKRKIKTHNKQVIYHVIRLTDNEPPGFPGECFICELRLPDHRFRWKHNKLFLLLPEEYGPAFPAIVDCYTSPPT
ncbi:colanic acid capsullar biosynthesis activation protein A [Escherichia coli]|uniref:Colanic acid capsullar biosynthesis activation protein A n=1 Tax=Escherichia coli TaxID=562 RepID=A0A377D2U2_ECOLX|nr:colanic acid capsullar biosynthesis activation protein A [Escherichia coli]